MTQTLTIEVPDPPEGLEYTSEYRQAKADEYSMNFDGEVWEGATIGCYLILRKIVRPTLDTKGLLASGWVAKNRSHVWYWYRSKPKFGGGQWVSMDGVLSRVAHLAIDWPDVEPKDSLFEVTA